MKSILSLLIFICFIQAQEINKIEEDRKFHNKNTLSINWISSLEKNIKRDFYINEYLKSNISPEESLKALALIDNMTNEIFLNFAKKFNHDETLAVAQCMQMENKYLIDSYANCIKVGLSIEDATTLSSIDIELIIQKISKKYPYFAKQLKVISSAIPFTKLIILNKDQFYDLYLNVGDKFRSKYFNYKLPQRTLTKIFTDKEKFNKFLKLSLINPNLNQLHKSLLKINDSKLNENSSFLLALNAVRYNDLILANKYLKNAIKKDKENKNKDKYNFWLYKINKNKDILVNLSNSFDFNLYSIYSDELLQKYNNYDIYLDDIKLFNNYEEKYDINRVALLYSIAKIKSGFNSSKISKIFELGIMQLKPNLIKNISKKLNKEYNILNQFRIEDSLKYTNIHINNLEGKFNNPLEIFLNYKENIETSLENEKFFNIKNPYEPFISIELLSFDNILLKDFIIYYYLYYNNFLENYEELTFSSIFEELLSNDQN